MLAHLSSSLAAVTSCVKVAFLALMGSRGSSTLSMTNRRCSSFYSAATMWRRLSGKTSVYLLVSINSLPPQRRRRMNVVPPADTMSLWSEEECKAFETGLRVYGKDFHSIQNLYWIGKRKCFSTRYHRR